LGGSGHPVIISVTANSSAKRVMFLIEFYSYRKGRLSLAEKGITDIL
jgi:hypothetical protein